jgi:hypothetical protein
MHKAMVGAIAVASMLAMTTFTSAAQQVVAPNSVRLQHQQIIAHLERFTRERGSLGTAAQKAVDFLKGHYAKEEEFVLPPLGLLSALVANQASKADMEQALKMAEQTKAASNALYADHVQITTLMTELTDAANERNGRELVRLATRVAAQSLNDMEVFHPATILIGEYIRLRLQQTK